MRIVTAVSLAWAAGCFIKVLVTIESYSSAFRAVSERFKQPKRLAIGRRPGRRAG
jgi:hypothetical protein